MQPRAYREGKAVGDLKESVFKAYIVQIRRLRGNLGLLLLQSTAELNADAKAIRFPGFLMNNESAAQQMQGSCQAG